MALLFKAYRTNFSERFELRITIDPVDTPADQKEARQILDIPRDEWFYVQILRQSEMKGGIHEIPTQPPDPSGPAVHSRSNAES